MIFHRAVLGLCFAASLSTTNAGFWSSSKEVEKAIDEVNTIDEDTVSDDGSTYGVDVSFPMHHATVSNNYAHLPHNVDPNIPTPREYKDMAVQPLGDRQAFYQDFLQTCRDAFGSKGKRCTQTEVDRIAMTLRQPQSMTNYTDVGFKSKYSSLATELATPLHFTLWSRARRCVYCNFVNFP